MEEEAPWLLVVSSPCTRFSTRQNFNINKIEVDEAYRRMKGAMTNVAFAVLPSLRPAKAGRKFVFEHSVGASSWRTALLNRLFFVKDGARVDFDFCILGMKSKDADGEAPAKKRTGMTNSPMVVEELGKNQCDKNHRHAILSDDRAEACQEYAPELCELVCKTVMKEPERASRSGSGRKLRKSRKKRPIFLNK